MINKYTLAWCGHEFETKKNIKTKMVSWFLVFICPKCWYYNWKLKNNIEVID
jgi:hypothetical protein